MADFAWAFAHEVDGQHPRAVYVLTNTRSLDPAEAAARNEEIVRNALAAAAAAGTAGGGLRLSFVSRSDSTLRGHFPLEPDVIAATVTAVNGEATDGVVIVPAFPDAGRVTIGGVHFTRGTGENAGKLTPVADTEFARDASFGFANSEMAKYVEEKSQGRFPADSVIVLDLNMIRAPPPIRRSPPRPSPTPSTQPRTPPRSWPSSRKRSPRPVTGAGRSRAPRQKAALPRRAAVRPRPDRPGNPQRTYRRRGLRRQHPFEAGGLIVLGSHVGVTTRQLNALTEQHSAARIVEIDVEKLLGDNAAAYLDETVDTVVAALRGGDVIVHTSRLLIKTDDAAASLKIAGTVSAAVVAVVNRTLKTFPPAS